MDLLPEIRKRYSVRKFDDTPVEKNQIERILEAGRIAPSAKNRQTWRFVVVQDPEIRSRIEAASYGQEHVATAPLIIVACTTNIDYTMPNGQLSYPIDISIAVSFMMLQAVNEGLGTCLVSTYDEEEVKEILTVPYSMRAVILLLVGHPADEKKPSRRMPLSRIVAYDHW